MKSSAQQLVIKFLGTVVLAAGFIFMVARTPFLTQTAAVTSPEMTAESLQQLRVENIKLDTGARRNNSIFSGSAVALAGLTPPTGLFQAQFGAAGTDAGFASREQQVEGDCMGAGRRYIEQVCPGCQVLSGDGKSGQSVEPGVVMWMDGASGSEAVSAVSANCSRVAANGSAIVDVLRFAGGPLSLEQSGTQLALDIVPLLHRAERVAVFEMGGWLATMDEVPNPRTAINDMLIALKQRGWREASDHESADVKMFAQQRVFTNNDNALCVVTLSQEGDTAQLLTIMSSYTRG